MLDHLRIVHPVALLAGQIDHAIARTTASKPDIGHQRLAGTIHDTANYTKAHRRLDMLKPLFQRFDRLDHVKSLTRTTRTADDVHTAMPQAKRFQDFVPDLDLFHRIRRKADPDGIANAHPQQIAKANRRFDRSAGQAAGLCDAKMDRRVRRLCKLLIGGGGHEYVRGLHADLELVKIVVLQNTDMLQPALDHRVGTGLAVFVEQMLFETARIHTDPH